MSELTSIAPVLDTRDRPLRDLRISVTDRCNFRCTYCMPAEIFGEKYQFLPRQELLTFEELEILVRVFVDLGVGKLRISGGEPLLRHDLSTLIGRLSKIEGLVDTALTTNATLLPRQAENLYKAGLGRLTVSLDSLDEDIFRQMNGDKLSVAQVLEGIEAAEEGGLREDQDQLRGAKGRERSHDRRPRSSLSPQRSHPALHRIHGRRDPQ